ncbi:MAG TPA: N-acetylmuramoyl-L-alanine amidase [Kofleriaceae bacterium]|nr:N-acetylmuramoyl-L-alanine amidase [Kofleriaceae bacterium]
MEWIVLATAGMVITLVVDPGHGGARAVGGSSCWGGRGPRGTFEKDVTLALARRIAARAGGGMRVELTRDADRNLGLDERADSARRAGAHAFVSLHANHGPGAGRGAEVWTRPDAGPAASGLADALCRGLSAPGAGAQRLSGELAVLDPRRLGGAAGALIEVDCLSSEDGERRLTDARSLDDIADRVVSAVRSWGQWAHTQQGGTFPPVRYPTSPPDDRPPDPPPQPVPQPVPAPAPACPRTIYFAFDSDAIDESTSGWVLDEVAAWLTANQNEYVNLVGHTDPVDTDDYNQRLGQRRADAVAQALVRRGVAARQMGVSSMGERAPVSGGDPSRHYLDRRVEIECTASYGRPARRPPQVPRPRLSRGLEVQGPGSRGSCPTSVGFAFGSAELDDVGRSCVARVVDSLVDRPDALISLTGDHEAPIESARLAFERVEVVRQAFIDRGIPERRIASDPATPFGVLPAGRGRRVDIAVSGAIPLGPPGPLGPFGSRGSRGPLSRRA